LTFTDWRKILLLAFLIANVPVIGAESNITDATSRFKNEARQLIEEIESDTSTEFLFRNEDVISFADRKPPEAGDVEYFYTVNLKNNKPERIKARLTKIGRHCYVYVEQGRSIPAKNINRIVYHFDKRIYSECRAMFGSEWSPGIDGDKRITLLLLDIKDTYNPSAGQKGFTAGYFNAGDQFRRSQKKYSNQREMLYLDVYPGEAGSDKFLSVLAHEFQHMIHFHHDPKEFDWVDESLSQLAPFLCGYGHPPQLISFIRNPDNNLVAWAGDNTLANYGQVYLWAYYIATHISTTEDRRKAFVRRMVEQKSQGLSGLNAAIKKQRIKNNVANLFRSFCLANYLNAPRIERGAYGYNKYLGKLRLKPEFKTKANPARGKASVKCWSSRAIRIENRSFIGKNIQVSFAGQKKQAGRYSNRFDVAFVSFCSKRRSAPMVEWLSIRNYKANKEIKVPARHNQMMLLVVNRGTEVMKVEQAFAKGSGPAGFSFMISLASADVNHSAMVAADFSGQNRALRNSAGLRSSLQEIAKASFLEEISTSVLAQRDETDAEIQDDDKVSYELELQRITELEDELVNDFRASIEAKNYDMLEFFVSFHNTATLAEKTRLHALKSRILDVLRFEEMQGNTAVADYIAMLTSPN
jgi:hypothetical protein